MWNCPNVVMMIVTGLGYSHTRITPHATQAQLTGNGQWALANALAGWRIANTTLGRSEYTGGATVDLLPFSNIGRIRLVKFRPTILGSAHFLTVKTLLTEAGQSNGIICPRSNWKQGDTTNKFNLFN